LLLINLRKGTNVTSPRYKQFGIKLSLIFGFAKSSKYKTNFSIKPIAQIACSVCYSAVVLSKLLFNRKTFTLLLSNSNFHVFAFRFVIFGLLFQLFTFKFKFCSKDFKLRLTNSIFTFLLFILQLFKFLLADSDFHASAFQVSTFQISVGKFQFPRFCLLTFCGNKCLFSNCFYLRNFGTNWINPKSCGEILKRRYLCL
jgi:hypothetical protein